MKTPWYGLILLAGTITLLNACKPLCSDDVIYFHYARHISQHPLDPYGFRLLGGQPANEVLAPAGFLYWWAAGMWVFGDSPFLGKLCLFPVCLLAAWALYRLTRRFAPGLEWPVVIALLFSPLFLPCLNMMLDVPALALSLLAILLLVRACREGSAWPAVLAGLSAGLAMQTKYTAFTCPALLVLLAVLHGRWRLGLLAAGLAVLLFVSWEGYLAFLYGDSHFLVALGQRAEPPLRRLRLLLPLVATLGALACWVLPLGVAALGRARRAAWAAAGAAVLGLALVAAVPEEFALGWGEGSNSLELTTPKVVFGSLGLALGVLVLGGAYRLLRASVGGTGKPFLADRDGVFLVAWLAVEFAGYLALSPYPAVRRCLALHVVGILLLGRLLSVRLPTRAEDAPAGNGPAWLAASLSVGAGLLCFALTSLEAWLERRAAEVAFASIRSQHPGATIWCYSSGTFGHAAWCAGTRRWVGGVCPGGPDDWMVVMSPMPDAELQRRLRADFVPWTRHAVSSPSPLRTHYQWGGQPLQRVSEPLFEVHILRPRSAWAGRLPSGQR